MPAHSPPPTDTPALLARIADALERLAPPPPDAGALARGDAFVWRPHGGGLAPARTAALPLDLLRGVTAQKEALLANTRLFARGAAANDALLWGARGAGKSALVRSVVSAVTAEAPGLKIIEVAAADVAGLGVLAQAVAAASARAILFVDDLSLEGEDAALKALKPALDGGLSGAAGATIVYATSNRRQIVARDPAREAEGVFGRDLAEERLALADRFGLWLGFQTPDQDLFLEIVAAYADRLGLPLAPAALRERAVAWALRRGARSGRTARQFIVALCGELNVEPRF